MKTIMLGDDQLEVKDTEYLTDLIADALNDMGINPTSFAFHIEVEYDDAEEDTESFDRAFPELSDAAGKLMAMKAIQDADFGSKIADMIIGPLEK